VAWIVVLAVFIALAGLIAWAVHVSLTPASGQAELERTCFLSLREDPPPLVRQPVRGTPLTEEQRHGFAHTWRSVYNGFEADPASAIIYADVLVSALLRHHEAFAAAAGRRSDPSDARLKGEYQTARAAARRKAERAPSRDDLRKAIAMYATLFEKLISDASRRTERAEP